MHQIQCMSGSIYTPDVLVWHGCVRRKMTDAKRNVFLLVNLKWKTHPGVELRVLGRQGGRRHTRTDSDSYKRVCACLIGRRHACSGILISYSLIIFLDYLYMWRVIGRSVSNHLWILIKCRRVFVFGSIYQINIQTIMNRDITKDIIVCFFSKSYVQLYTLVDLWIIRLPTV